MEKIYNKLFKNTLTTILTVVVSVLVIVTAVSAVTTISTNISTGGTLDVTGVSTFTRATSTSATSTAYLYVGPTFSTDANFNYAGGDAAIAGVLNVGGVSYFDGAVQATSTLFVTDAATFYSLATFTTATSTSATTTEYLYVGHDISEPTGWDFAGGDLAVSGDAYFNNKATTSVAFTIGAPTANYINFAGGDLIVQGDVEVDGGIWTNSATTTDTLSIGGNATTSGETVLGATAPGNFATTTLTFGSYGTADTKGLCLKFFSGGVTIWCYFNTAALTGGAPTSTAFLCDSDSSTCE